MYRAGAGSAALLLLVLAAVAPPLRAQDEIVLDTFSTGTPGGPPDAPDVGSRTEYTGTHVLVDLGGGDRRMRSIDSVTDSNYSMAWWSLDVAERGTVDYLTRMEAGGSSRSDHEDVNLCVVSDPTCISKEYVSLHWQGDGKWRAQIGSGALFEVGATFGSETDYRVRWRFDALSDRFDLTIDGAQILAEQDLGFDATRFGLFTIVSSLAQVGNRLIDDVRVRSGWLLFENGFEAGGTGDWSATMPPPAPSGDSCSDPIPLPFASVVTGDLADNTGLVDDDSCGSSNTVDEWYLLETTCAGVVTVTTCLAETQFDTVLSVFDECDGSEVTCNDDDGAAACVLAGPGSKSTVSWAATGVEAYLVRVTAYQDQLVEGSTGFGVQATMACY